MSSARTIHVEKNPLPPPARVDERDRVFLGTGYPWVDYVVTAGEHLREVIEAGTGPAHGDGKIGVDGVIAHVLRDFHATADNEPEDFALWTGDGFAPRLVAVFRALPSGRRAVYLFGESGVSRRVYPKHENYTRRSKEAAR